MMTDANNTASTSKDGQEIRITPANRAVLKTLKDLNVKKARAEHHLGLITTALSDGRTLGGLRREVRPQLPDIPVELSIEWEEAHLVFADSLTKLLAKYWTTKKDSIDTEIHTSLGKLTIGTSDAETAQITTYSSAAFETESTKLQAPKPQRQPRTQWPKGKRRRVGDSNQGTNTGL
jgi:hypothetical protein